MGTDEFLGYCSPTFLKDFLPIAAWSMAMDASFCLVEKKCIQVQIKERIIISAACGNYISVPHQERIQLLELAAGHTARTRAVMDIRGPLACLLALLQVQLTLILRCSASSSAVKLLTV